MPDELQELLDRVHDGITSIDFEGRETPCIVVTDEKYAEMMAKVAGQSFSVETDLNILQNGLGDVFVEVLLTFSRGGITELFLINAATDLRFFERLAQTTVLALSSTRLGQGSDNVFVIQLPRPEKAQDALDIIRDGLSKRPKTKDGAVTGI